ncbi:hypothetical protein [Pseudomonas phage vB_Pae_CF23a]|nr:hypothetical protein [Pseudomonas phage vB_Pae_CF23a]QBI80031.1 hypothetical protein [Pseudomonas phage vB_Pae_CF57a]QBI80120.1 hypothetical protein [Pseudomonas phage vB_Pae_CF65a]QBI80257.1 hypothetical protein [Pseudomonas phage vB_Pae_CF81a]QBI80344.1 hypothetical protein [Pseudomonas phage vB_Pae_CF118a]QBI80594.1 hypothetical protein [Pseudomonas phage vB_Pae_CF177c]QBI80681.1 hypothetical protein [Pseudomonas phage vB_Pae_CF213a]
MAASPHGKEMLRSSLDKSKVVPSAISTQLSDKNAEIGRCELGCETKF